MASPNSRPCGLVRIQQVPRRQSCAQGWDPALEPWGLHRPITPLPGVIRGLGHKGGRPCPLRFTHPFLSGCRSWPWGPRCLQAAFELLCVQTSQLVSAGGAVWCKPPCPRQEEGLVASPLCAALTGSCFVVVLRRRLCCRVRLSPLLGLAVRSRQKPWGWGCAGAWPPCRCRWCSSVRGAGALCSGERPCPDLASPLLAHIPGDPRPGHEHTLVTDGTLGPWVALCGLFQAWLSGASGVSVTL